MLLMELFSISRLDLGSLILHSCSGGAHLGSGFSVNIILFPIQFLKLLVLFFSLFSSLSFFLSLFVLKYSIDFTTLGCCLFPFYLPLALLLSNAEKEVCIAFSPCPLALLVYSLVKCA